jgi:hypothetical protein
LHGKFDNFDHRSYRFLENFRNRLIVQDGLREIRVDDCAEAKKNDVTEQLRVISRWITDDRVLAQLLH